MPHSDETEQSNPSRRVSKGIWVSYLRQAEAQALSVYVPTGVPEKKLYWLRDIIVRFITFWGKKTGTTKAAVLCQM